MTSKRLAGVLRSLRLYHASEAPRAAMDRLYSGFVAEGDLVMDIGAHVGDRVSSFRRLGASVVAVEPQPHLMRVLRLIHGRDRQVVFVPAAVAERSGTLNLRLNTANPTVSTASSEFIARSGGASGWEGQVWDAEIQVPALTLDDLIAEFGVPRFIKIDVEGYEDRVLAGLSEAMPALSFEFTTIAVDVARRCLERLAALGDYRFNLAYGESQSLIAGSWLTGMEMAEILEQMPPEKNSGDIYARRLAAS